MKHETEHRTFSKPDEVRSFPNGRAEILVIGGGEVGRLVLQPGSRWSNDVKPIAGTDSCQVEHVGYVLSGRMKVVMDDGSESEVGPGDAVYIAPGHDAWTVGDEACVFVDFGDVEHYAEAH